jgi:hypothetical protein
MSTARLGITVITRNARDFVRLAEFGTFQWEVRNFRGIQLSKRSGTVVKRNSTRKGRVRLASRRLAVHAAHPSTNSNTESQNGERSNKTKSS